MSEINVHINTGGEDAGTVHEIRINTHGNPVPECHGEWVDLSTAEEVHMKQGEFRMIDLGVSMELPEGFYGIMAPRSSTCKRWGLIQANSIGVFESEFKGDGDIWMFPAYAIRDTDIPKGTRLCQFQIFRKPVKLVFRAVDSLGNKDRGGWGSTGTAVTVPASDDWKKG